MIEYWKLFLTFLKLGFLSFGGGYAMLSMIMTEARAFSIGPSQFADLNVLDMVVPGSIAINAATYVGFLHRGMAGAVAATLGVSLPSFILTVVVMRFFARFKDHNWLNDILSGIKPAAVGLIAAAAVTIALDVLPVIGKTSQDLLTSPLTSISYVAVAIFGLTAFLNIRLNINPILLTVLAGIAGAIFIH